MNTFLIFSIIMTLLGGVLVVSAFSMKRSGKISRLFLAEEELRKCARPLEFISYMAPRVRVFGAELILIGIAGMVSDGRLFVIPFWHYIQLGIIIVVFVVFALQMKKARRDFV